MRSPHDPRDPGPRAGAAGEEDTLGRFDQACASAAGSDSPDAELRPDLTPAQYDEFRTRILDSSEEDWNFLGNGGIWGTYEATHTLFLPDGRKLVIKLGIPDSGGQSEASLEIEGNLPGGRKPRKYWESIQLVAKGPLTDGLHDEVRTIRAQRAGRDVMEQRGYYDPSPNADIW